MQKIVRKNDKEITSVTHVHCCILPSSGEKGIVNGSERFLFSILKSGVAVLIKLNRKMLRRHINGTVVYPITKNSIYVHWAESKHRLRTYTKATYRAVARTHSSLLRWKKTDIVSLFERVIV